MRNTPGANQKSRFACLVHCIPDVVASLDSVGQGMSVYVHSGRGGFRCKIARICVQSNASDSIAMSFFYD